MKKKIIIAGAGAAGLLAAGRAASLGAEVLLLEKMENPGKKLLISGKGRCNITNDMPVSEFISHYNKNGKFLRQCFNLFFSRQLKDFFENQSVPLVTERGGRVFPKSGKANDIVKALLQSAQRNNVQLKCNARVTDILVKEKSIYGVICNNKEIHSNSVILATGGYSYPQTGSTGDGYHLAKNCGHSLTRLRPALVPLTSEEDLSSLAGLDLKNISLRIIVNGKRKKNDFGELSFSMSGIGGPLILTHSLSMIDELHKGHSLQISLDLKPALDNKKMDNRLQREFAEKPKEKLSAILRSLLPKQLISICLLHTGLYGEQIVNTLTSKQRKKIGAWLKDFRIRINGHKPIEKAIITAGGIPVNEVDPHSMESKIINELYITGELLDIHGKTGGYNLQAAFSTGWAAGNAAANLKK